MLFRIENTSLVSAVVKTYIFLAFGITRYLNYGRINDKLNKSCAIALSFCKSKNNKKWRHSRKTWYIMLAISFDRDGHDTDTKYRYCRYL